ncbi:hypothetical protein DUNSADRAFT_7958 [Dunaliella salina]|uniref:Secreted protein n=1 Tax=Dunaliella salina TaxID=3046 RepID=A0ABQ7H615_DUNSA|nr:hypothetical protein DUNSADRAFT_7958 [Dunaliella salina]|eukprot:KAF5842305.1 hypothetical protein DUNSADRAFT_7958 [Dunaliella salina]
MVLLCCIKTVVACLRLTCGNTSWNLVRACYLGSAAWTVFVFYFCMSGMRSALALSTTSIIKGRGVTCRRQEMSFFPERLLLKFVLRSGPIMSSW